MIATIILLCLLTSNLTVHLVKHKELKEGYDAYYDFWLALIAYIIDIVLLYFAGAFSCFSE